LALALGARRMAAHRAIPRRLHAVETLGSVTVVAADKTGTLTEGRMAVRTAIDADGREYTVTGQGYEPAGEIHGPVGPGLAELARAALLCSDATLLPPDAEHPQWRGRRGPPPAARGALARPPRPGPPARRAGWPRAGGHPLP